MAYLARLGIALALASWLSPSAVGAQGGELDRCAADMRARVGGGRGSLADWHPVCRAMEKEGARKAAAEQRARADGEADPRAAAERRLRLENCLNTPNPTWEGKRVMRSWWEAHCRWFTGQPGAQQPAAP